MKKFTVSVAAALAMSTFVIAGGDIAPVEPVVEEVVDDSGFYIGGAYSSISEEEVQVVYSTSPYEYNYNWNALMLQTGYKFNKYVALEGRYWLGLGDPDVEENGNPLDHEGDFTA